MIKVKPLKNRHNIKAKRLTIKTIAISIILLGLLFSMVNFMKFAKGYLAFRTNDQNNQWVDKTAENDINPSQDSIISKYNLAKDDLIKRSNKNLLYTVRPETGDKIGELYIPKLNATLPIYEGTVDDVLEKGVGHFLKSVLPGEKDNCVLSGHRDTVFRKLGEIGDGDTLIVRTVAGEFEYQVSKVRIVDKDDLTVIVPKPRATLTVTTCYPFEYIGSAPERYILVANLITETLY